MYKQMRTSYYEQPQKSTWVKWVMIFLLLTIIALLTYMIILYNDIQEDRQIGFSETKKIVLRDTDLVEITEIQRYHGEFAYHIVFGHTENNEQQIVYVPLTNAEEELMIVNKSDIVPKESIEKQLQNECNTCKIISIIPGIEDNELLWELTYVDASERYVLEYVSIYDATPYEQFRFTRLYK